MHQRMSGPGNTLTMGHYVAKVLAQIGVRGTKDHQMTGSQKKFLVVVCVLGIYVGFTAPAHAYLDPGTGSLLLQGLIASVAAAAATGSIYWGKIRAYFSKKKDPDDGRSDEQGKDNE